jgi:uncharacterized heparinase superfamily protein
MSRDARALAWEVSRRWRGARLAVRRRVRWLVPFGRIRVSRLLFAPPDLRTADPTVAADIYAGHFSFAGRTVSVGTESVFRVVPPGEAWAAALYGFGWLRHLRAAETPLARANARALVDDYLALGRRVHPIALDTGVVARRLMSYLAQAPLLLDGADHDFYQDYLTAVRADALRLAEARRLSDAPQDRLAALLALTLVAYAAEGEEALARRYGEELSRELEDQILADGGHLSRNPRVLIDLLLDLLPLKATAAARGQEPPTSLVPAIDRIVPHLKMLRHPDGSIALFNGMGASQVDVLATLFASHDVRGRSALEAPYAGYQRLEAGSAVLIVDTGPVPPFAASAEAHAGTLAFEFSDGPQRLIVNCGAMRRPPPDLAAAIRSTAANSCPVVAETSHCRFVQRGAETRISQGPTHVTAARDQSALGERLALSHDGYQRGFGLDVTRVLTLAADGSELSGRDGLTGTNAAATPWLVRFHLHPSLRAAITEGGDALLVGARGAWRFAADAPLSVEESIFFAGLDGARRTSQIVLSPPEGTASVSWRLTRDG